jgi:TIR domain-containing protein
MTDCDHHVFISYPWRDEEMLEIQHFASKIINRIENRYLGKLRKFIWLDADRLGYPEVFPFSELESRLAEGVRSARHILCFVSPHYLESSWCRFEWGVALGTGVPICPIVWKGAFGTFPPMGFVHYIDARPAIDALREYHNDEQRPEFQRLVDDIHNFLDKEMYLRWRADNLVRP